MVTKKTINGVVCGCLAALCCLSLSTPARAEFGDKHDFAIGAERLFGFYSVDIEADLPGGGQSNRGVSSKGFGFQEPVALFDIARIGFDYFVIDSLSVGGNLGFFSYDPDTDDDDSDEQDGLIFSPRVGYVVPFNDSWGIWPRGGFTYASRDGNRVVTQTALSLEVPFYFMPTSGVGFTAAPVFDIGLSGHWRAPGGNREDYSETAFGLVFGMFGAF